MRTFIIRHIPLLLVLSACTKIAPVSSVAPPHTAYDTTRDVRRMLDSVPGFSLFALAVRTAGVDTLLSPGGFYTLFVPTDSAMKAKSQNKTSSRPPATAIPLTSATTGFGYCGIRWKIS